MTRENQKKLIATITTDLAKTIREKIDAGKIPEDWDGIELRQYLADKAREYVFQHTGNRTRWKNYRNAIIVNNL